MVVLAHRLLFLGYQRTAGQKRRQLETIFFAFAIGYLGGTSVLLPTFGILIYPYGNFSVPIYCLVVTYAIVKHHFLGIDVAIRKGLVYSILATLITSTYLVIIILSERLLQGMIGYRSIVGTVVAAFIIALGFTPVKNMIQRWVDRLFFGGSQEVLAEENERLRQELIQSERLKSVALLASGLAHEIKNPLASIKTFTEYLPQRHSDEAFVQKFQHIVSQEIEKIQTIVTNLLTFAKPQPLRHGTLCLGQVVQETLVLLNSDCLKRKVELEARVDPSVSVMGDRTHLKQALLNLCLNSLEAMDEGGKLRVGVETHNAHATLFVEDTGSGISPQNLPHVFDPFFTTKETGTGLGLSVVHGIIKEHGGKIRIDSHPGQGTSVTIHLPSNRFSP